MATIYNTGVIAAWHRRQAARKAAETEIPPYATERLRELTAEQVTQWVGMYQYHKRLLEQYEGSHDPSMKARIWKHGQLLTKLLTTHEAWYRHA